MTAAITVDWASFGEVVVVTLVTSLVAVALFSVGITALARARPSLDARGDDTGPADAASRPGAVLVAGVCFLAVAAIVVYGLFLVVHR